MSIRSMNRRHLLVAGGALLPATLYTTSSAIANTSSPTAADIGFCQDMSIHHLQALAMCQRVIGRDTGDSVQAAAGEVLQNQSMEVGQMRAWLADWGESTVPPTTVMAWMGANQGRGMPLENMPGYASKEQLLELSTMTGMARGRKWLELMRSHHVGGVSMASQAAVLCSSDKVIRLANVQVRTQNYEIEIYDQLLAGTYAY